MFLGGERLIFGVTSPFKIERMMLPVLCMNKMYVIYWRSRTNGRMGTGTTRFDHAEANRLVEELNHDFPEIEHRVLEANGEPAHEEAASLAHVTSE